VSLDSRNLSERVDSVLIVPFGSQGADGPTTMRFEPGETGLPGPAWMKGHFIATLKKSILGERLAAPALGVAHAAGPSGYSARVRSGVTAPVRCLAFPQPGTQPAILDGLAALLLACRAASRRARDSAEAFVAPDFGDSSVVRPATSSS